MKDNNFFELFGLEVQFELNESELTSRYRSLQSQVHPDKFANATEKERLLSVQKAALVNDAYQTLKSPLIRTKYILSLHGIMLDDEQTTTLMDPGFLMEQMELRESLSAIKNASNPESLLDDIYNTIDNKEQKLISSIRLKLEIASKESLEDTANYVRELQFFQKLKEETEQLEAELDL